MMLLLLLLGPFNVTFPSCCFGLDQIFSWSRDVFSGSSTLWVERLWNQRIWFINMILFSLSSGASEGASKWMSVSELASEASSAELANEWCERTSEWPRSLHVDFIVIPPKVRLCVCVRVTVCVLFDIPCHRGTAISLISVSRLCVCVCVCPFLICEDVSKKEKKTCNWSLNGSIANHWLR